MILLIVLLMITIVSQLVRAREITETERELAAEIKEQRQVIELKEENERLKDQRIQNLERRLRESSKYYEDKIGFWQARARLSNRGKVKYGFYGAGILAIIQSSLGG